MKNEQTVFLLQIKCLLLSYLSLMIMIKVARAELSYNSKISQQNEINY